MFSCVRQPNSDRSNASANHKRQQHKCDVELTLNGMEGVTLSNGVLFAKVRLLSGGQFCRYSSRREIRDNRVTWSRHCGNEVAVETPGEANSEPSLQFSCRLPAGVIRVSVRKEEKGGRSFSKLGFVNIDLATVGCRNRAEQRAFILTPYSPNQRLDNSTLRLSLCLRCEEAMEAELQPLQLQEVRLLQESGSASESMPPLPPPVLPQLQMPQFLHQQQQLLQASPLSPPLPTAFLDCGHWRRLSDCSSIVSGNTGPGSDSRAGSLGRDAALIGQSPIYASGALGASGCVHSPGCSGGAAVDTASCCLTSLAADRKRLGCWTSASIRSDLPERIVNTRANNQSIVEQVLHEHGIHVIGARNLSDYDRLCFTSD